jgi:hypothetical protein
LELKLLELIAWRTTKQRMKRELPLYITHGGMYIHTTGRYRMGPSQTLEPFGGERKPVMLACHASDFGTFWRGKEASHATIACHAQSLEEGQARVWKFENTTLIRMF